jgi:hypothetical protein
MAACLFQRGQKLDPIFLTALLGRLSDGFQYRFLGAQMITPAISKLSWSQIELRHRLHMELLDAAIMAAGVEDQELRLTPFGDIRSKATVLVEQLLALKAKHRLTKESREASHHHQQLLDCQTQLQHLWAKIAEVAEQNVAKLEAAQQSADDVLEEAAQQIRCDIWRGGK